MILPGKKPPERWTIGEIREAQNRAAEAGEITAARIDTVGILVDLDTHGAAEIGQRESDGRRYIAHVIDHRREYGEVVRLTGRAPGNQKAATMICPTCRREYIETMPEALPVGRKPRPWSAFLRPCDHCEPSGIQLFEIPAEEAGPILAALLASLGAPATAPGPEKPGDPTAADIRKSADLQGDNRLN